MRIGRELRTGLVLSLFLSCWGSAAMAQDSGREAVDIFLDEEKVDVEADIPSVDLFLTFRGLHYESLDAKKSFLPELYRSVEQEPF